MAWDPLWGSLFENFVVMEALKDRFNRGDPAPLHFSVGSHWFRGLAQFRKDHAGHLEAGCVVYGGDAIQAPSDWPVWSWKALLQGPPG